MVESEHATCIIQATLNMRYSLYGVHYVGDYLTQGWWFAFCHKSRNCAVSMATTAPVSSMRRAASSWARRIHPSASTLPGDRLQRRAVRSPEAGTTCCPPWLNSA